MSMQAASVESVISTILISNYRILELFWEKDLAFDFQWSVLRERTYLAFQPWAARYPDHIFEGSWHSLENKASGHCILLAALDALVREFIEPSHGDSRVKREMMGAWQQGIVSRVSVLPIKAAANAAFIGDHNLNSEELRGAYRSSDVAEVPWRRTLMPVLHYHESIVEEYIKKEGLHEAHLHLNGSTFAETCWLRALRTPYTEIKGFNAAWKGNRKKPSMPELVAQVNPELGPARLFHHLRTAARLRVWLRAIVENRVLPDAQFPFSLAQLGSSGEDEWTVGLIDILPEKSEMRDIQGELDWMTTLIVRLRQRPSIIHSRMFHAYLLLQNEYCQLLVQNEQQYGFDQFQKFTYTELRESAEAEYKARFCTMHGLQTNYSKVGYLEGRFAPKDTVKKSEHLLRAILGGYLEYLQDASEESLAMGRIRSASLTSLLSLLDQYFRTNGQDHRRIHRLALVVHFIKQAWSPGHGLTSGLYRHYGLDRDLRERTIVLLNCLKLWPMLRHWIRGIDAAANELHAPPDVFAATFRICSRAGLTRRTYHAGEDFRHILTGIAVIYEALNFLDLRNGDRIGHGTAMGIHPKLWLERMPGNITLPRGEWMLGMLAAWKMARDIPDLVALTNNLQRELEEIACQIFQRPLSSSAIERAMDLRGLSRLDVMYNQSEYKTSKGESFGLLWQEERELVRKAADEQPQDMALLWEWLSDKKIQMRSEEFIVIKSAFLKTDDYIKLQQQLMKEVARRGVLIETLPSSNVRISQYQHIREHHSLRWMRVPGHLVEGDPEIMVCLGSDDPGIFGSDLETEFYLLYAAMREHDLNDTEVVKRLGIVNERGRIYRFHHPIVN